MRPNQAYVGHLETNDVILLSILGAVRDDRAPLNAIISTAKEMAPEDWQPTADLVSGCILNAVNTSLLRLACPGEPDPALQLEITESGRYVLRRLLKQSIPCHRGGFGRTCLAAKLCFLECLDPHEQLLQIEELAQGYREHIEVLRNHLDTRAMYRSVPRRWLGHEIERFEWELAWLDRLRSDLRRPSEPKPVRAAIDERSA